MDKLISFVVAAIIAGTAVAVYTGKAELTPGAIALYLIVDAIAIAVRAINRD